MKMKMLSNYYDCPKDYRKDFRLIIFQAVSRVLGTTIILMIMVLLLIGLS